MPRACAAAVPCGPMERRDIVTKAMQGGQLQGGGARGSAANAGTWTAFLVVAFGVLGLIGAFSVFAAQIPFERALARNIALDHALAVAGEPDGAEKLEAMRPALDDSADRIIIATPGKSGPDMVQRVADERARMLTAFGREAVDIGVRLRIVIAVFTVACAMFGVAVLSIVRRSK